VLDFSAPLVFTIAGLCTSSECAALIARIEEIGPEDAPITTERGFVMRPDIRNNTRVMFDDLEHAADLTVACRDPGAWVCHRSRCLPASRDQAAGGLASAARPRQAEAT
jgi:hypothetical protein